MGNPSSSEMKHPGSRVSIRGSKKSTKKKKDKKRDKYKYFDHDNIDEYSNASSTEKSQDSSSSQDDRELKPPMAPNLNKDSSDEDEFNQPVPRDVINSDLENPRYEQLPLYENLLRGHESGSSGNRDLEGDQVQGAGGNPPDRPLSPVEQELLDDIAH